jgi:excisionase family DNA binding protein
MSTPVLERTLLTVDETADVLRVSAKTVRRRIAAGELPAVQLGPSGSPLRIPEDELLRWLNDVPVAGGSTSHAAREGLAERGAPSGAVEALPLAGLEGAR